MKRYLIAAALALAVTSPAADARPPAEQPSLLYRLFHPTPATKVVRHHYRHRAGHVVESGRPAECRGIAWCGCWLRLRLGIADKALNQARRWASWGRAAGGAVVGAIAVWPHHVGIITGVPRPGRITLLSGNDGHAVRERERSTRGVIAYRTSP